MQLLQVCVILGKGNLQLSQCWVVVSMTMRQLLGYALTSMPVVMDYCGAASWLQDLAGPDLYALAAPLPLCRTPCADLCQHCLWPRHVGSVCMLCP